MLTRVRIGPPGGDFVNLDYGLDPLNGGYDLISASGLEPPTVDVNYSRYALVPGGRFHSASTDVRNLIFRVGLKPAPGSGKTVLDMRRDLFHAIPAGEQLSIRLWNDGIYELRIDGYLENIDSDYFTKDPEIQISIVCPEPYFRVPSITRYEGQRPDRIITVINQGDIPTGFTVTFNITGTFNNTLRLYNDTTGSLLEVQRDWSSGMRVRIVTEEGSREVTRRNAAGSIQEHLLGRTDITNGWPVLVKGENRIRVQSANSDGNWNWDLSHTQYFGGF